MRFGWIFLLVGSVFSICFSAETKETRLPFRELQLPDSIDTLATRGNTLVGWHRSNNTFYAWNWNDLNAPPNRYDNSRDLDITCFNQEMIVESADSPGDPWRVHFLEIKDPNTGRIIKREKLGSEWYVHELQRSQNGKYQGCLLAFDSVVADSITTLTDKTVYALGLIDMAKGNVSWVRPIIHRNIEGNLTLSGVSVSREGNYVVSFGCDGSGGWIHVVNPRKGITIWERSPESSCAFNRIEISPDERIVYATGTLGYLYAFDIASGRVVCRFPVRQSKFGRRISSPLDVLQEVLIAAGEVDGTDIGAHIIRFAASYNGHFVAVVSEPKGEVYVGNAETGKVIHTFITGRSPVHGLALSPDCRFLATRSISGRTIKIWKMPEAVFSAKKNLTIFNMVKLGNIAKLKTLLLVKPTAVNSKDAYGRTPLHWAVISDKEDCVRILVKAGSDPNARDFDGWTPLHYWASGDGGHKAAQFLLRSGVDVNARTRQGWTPLHYAAEKGQTKSADELLVHGAEVNYQDGSLEAPLHISAVYGYANVTKILLENNADHTLRNKYGGNTALHLAAEQGYLEVVRVLLTTGANVDALNEYKQTALILAAEANEPKVAKLLLENGANVNASAGHGTPLHIASLHGYRVLVELLLAHGADVTAKVWNDWTPLRSARAWHDDGPSKRQKERKEVEEILIKYGAKE